MSEENELPPRELFDDDLAAQLVGKTLLIGVTHVDHAGRELRRSQRFGRVVIADRLQGICVRPDDDGEETWLPPDTRGIKRARPGEYRNRATGELVVNPDFVASWTYTEPPPTI